MVDKYLEAMQSAMYVLLNFPTYIQELDIYKTTHPEVLGSLINSLNQTIIRAYPTIFGLHNLMEF